MAPPVSVVPPPASVVGLMTHLASADSDPEDNAYEQIALRACPQRPYTPRGHPDPGWPRSRSNVYAKFYFFATSPFSAISVFVMSVCDLRAVAIRSAGLLSSV